MPAPRPRPVASEDPAERAEIKALQSQRWAMLQKAAADKRAKEAKDTAIQEEEAEEHAKDNEADAEARAAEAASLLIRAAEYGEALPEELAAALPARKQRPDDGSKKRKTKWEEGPDINAEAAAEAIEAVVSGDAKRAVKAKKEAQAAAEAEAADRQAKEAEAAAAATNTPDKPMGGWEQWLAGAVAAAEGMQQFPMEAVMAQMQAAGIAPEAVMAHMAAGTTSAEGTIAQMAVGTPAMSNEAVIAQMAAAGASAEDIMAQMQQSAVGSGNGARWW